jgi:putative hydrolase of the HAD superfamily
MAIISNWDSRLPALIDRLGIRHYFETLTVSALVGYEKPHPAIFQIALERASLEPHQALYIGDDIVLDYHAARKAGMYALHLDRSSRFDPHDDTITSLAELFSRLDLGALNHEDHESYEEHK